MWSRRINCRVRRISTQQNEGPCMQALDVWLFMWLTWIRSDLNVLGRSLRWTVFNTYILVRWKLVVYQVVNQFPKTPGSVCMPCKFVFSQCSSATVIWDNIQFSGVTLRWTVSLTHTLVGSRLFVPGSCGNHVFFFLRRSLDLAVWNFLHICDLWDVRWSSVRVCMLALRHNLSMSPYCFHSAVYCCFSGEGGSVTRMTAFICLMYHARTIYWISLFLETKYIYLCTEKQGYTHMCTFILSLAVWWWFHACTIIIAKVINWCENCRISWYRFLGWPCMMRGSNAWCCLHTYVYFHFESGCVMMISCLYHHICEGHKMM